jgi:hypothetical protein
MAKWCGKIGYVESVEDEARPGIWVNKVTERVYTGDLIKNFHRWSASSDSTIDNLSPDNQISIIADTFAEENIRFMRYIEFMGAKWKINSFDVQRPRIILTMGGLYHDGEQA